MVLCGAETPERKFVDWEIYATLYAEHGLIGVALPTVQRDTSGAAIVPARLYDNIQSGYALWRSWNEVTAANVRAWMEESIARRKDLIRNGREKKTRNG